MPNSLLPSFAPAKRTNAGRRPVRRRTIRGESRVKSWPIAVLGVPFDNVTIAEAVDRIEKMIATRRPHYVVTANVDFLVQARRDVELRRVLIEADLVLCDGAPLVWASRWLGNPLPERAAGSDVVPLLMHEATGRGHRIFLLGAGPRVAAEAAARLREQYPSLNIVGQYTPPFRSLMDLDHEEIIRRVQAAQPDVLLVSFGCPKQEKWISMHYRTLGVPVVMGVGATLDFLAGRMKRAPQVMRHSGTEWLYRLWQEPRRLFRRYADDLCRFLPALAAQWRQMLPRSGRFATPTRQSIFVGTTWFRVSVSGALDIGSLRRHARFWQEALQERRHGLCDLSQVCAIDSTGVAVLIRWRQRLLAEGHRFVLLAPSAEVRRVLQALQLSDHFLVARDWAAAQQLVDAERFGPAPVTLSGSSRPLAWQGEVTAANTAEVWQLTVQFLRALGIKGTTTVIDLSRLRFIDSTGVGLMLRVVEFARKLGMKVTFGEAPANVRNVLHLSQLGWLLNQDAR
jgi:N-acetylglucosaminyldiphosphoundecaprenol N-acetyl-beta-D-mannosaminyltransferase